MSNHEMRFADILLVEDNDGDVFLTKKAFQKAKVGNEIFVAKDGEVAMEMLYKRGEFHNFPRPDLILLDINLPKKDGCEVLQEIKADDDLRRIPVVILTGSQAEEDVVRSYNFHANAYLVKPVDLHKFQEVIQSLEDFWFNVVVLPDRAGERSS